VLVSCYSHSRCLVGGGSECSRQSQLFASCGHRHRSLLPLSRTRVGVVGPTRAEIRSANAHESKTNRVPVPVTSIARLSESPGTCRPVPAAPPPLAEHGRAAYGRALLRQGKIHPSDALQAGFLDVAKRVESGLSGCRLPGVCLAATGGLRWADDGPPPPPEDAGREVSLYRDPLPPVCSAALASILLGGRTVPSNAAFQAGQILLVQKPVNSLQPRDPEEVAARRHFE